jgi:hypothetical protein
MSGCDEIGNGWMDMIRQKSINNSREALKT